MAHTARGWHQDDGWHADGWHADGWHAFGANLQGWRLCKTTRKAWVTRCQNRRSCFRVRMLSRCGCQYQVIAQEPRKHGTPVANIKSLPRSRESMAHRGSGEKKGRLESDIVGQVSGTLSTWVASRRWVPCRWVACFRGEFARMAFVQDHPESMGDALPRQAILLPGPHAFAVRLPDIKSLHRSRESMAPRVANIKSLPRSRESMAHTARGWHAFGANLQGWRLCKTTPKAWVTRCQDRRSCFRVRMLSRCGCQYQVIAQEPRKHGTHSTWVACFRGEFARMAFVQDHPESMGDALPRQAILLPGSHAFAVMLPI